MWADKIKKKKKIKATFFQTGTRLDNVTMPYDMYGRLIIVNKITFEFWNVYKSDYREGGYVVFLARFVA